MLTRDNFSKEHIEELRLDSGNDPALLERVLYAFGLLEAITRVGLPFIFKGGTCLMLLLKRPMRLSTDIDIIVEPDTDIDSYIKEAGKIFPFIRVDEHKRIGKNNMNTKMDHRGFGSVEEMNEYMIQKWNGKVRKNDEVVIIGDLSWGTAEQTNELLTKLNGRLYLITGNHDRFVRQPEFRTSRFTWVKPYEELSDNKRKVVLCHYPIMCYNGQYRLDEAGNPKTYMLYGHVHDTQDQRLLEQFQEITRNTMTINAGGEEQSIPCNMINCFCMYSDYEPLTLDEWIELNKRRLSVK